MIKKIIYVTLIWFISGVVAAYAETSELKIGVLAKRSPDITLKHWNDTAHYLSLAIPQYHFTIIPLHFDEIESAVKTKRIDFLLANSGIYVNLSYEYYLRAIATLKRNLFGKGHTYFGSVVFSRKDKQHIQTFSDLKGKNIAAVAANSLGGWIAALREFKHDNVKVSNFASLDFLNSHDAVVYKILNGEKDVGIVRTDTLERMEAEGKIDINQFKILTGNSIKSSTSSDKIASFPFLLSTRLYPEWPMASLKHISESIAEDVSKALISMPADSDAALSSQTVGWTIPKNYSAIEITYNELKLGVFSELSDFTILDIAQRYWLYLVSGFFILTLLLAILIYIHNLNKELKISHQKLHELATHDCLTGLPNRQLFDEIALKYLSMAQRSGDKVIILFLDLDYFKSINDTYGHDAGDFVLIEIASRIKQSLRPNDIIARIGGDEFLLMLWGVNSVENIQGTIKRIQNNVLLPILYQKENKLQVGCSIGVSLYPDDGEDLKELIKKADLALYDGKENGRGKVVFYQPKPSTNNETL